MGYLLKAAALFALAAGSNVMPHNRPIYTSNAPRAENYSELWVGDSISTRFLLSDIIEMMREREKKEGRLSNVVSDTIPAGEGKIHLVYIDTNSNGRVDEADELRTDVLLGDKLITYVDSGVNGPRPRSDSYLEGDEVSVDGVKVGNHLHPLWSYYFGIMKDVQKALKTRKNIEEIINFPSRR